jgi:predicted HicB family RNase H-like nuclease
MVTKQEKLIAINSELHKMLKLTAALKGVSIKQYVTDTLSSAINRDREGF